MEEFSKIHETARRLCLSIVVQEVQMVIFCTLDLWFDGDFKLLCTAVRYLQFEGCFKSQLQSRLYPASRDVHVEIYPVSRNCCIAVYCFFLSNLSDCNKLFVQTAECFKFVMSEFGYLSCLLCSFSLSSLEWVKSVNSGATNNFLRGGKSEKEGKSSFKLTTMELNRTN